MTASTKHFTLHELPEGIFQLRFDGVSVDVGYPDLTCPFEAEAILRDLEPSRRVRERKIPGRVTRAVDGVRAKVNF